METTLRIIRRKGKFVIHQPTDKTIHIDAEKSLYFSKIRQCARSAGENKLIARGLQPKICRNWYQYTRNTPEIYYFRKQNDFLEQTTSNSRAPQPPPPPNLDPSFLRFFTWNIYQPEGLWLSLNTRRNIWKKGTLRGTFLVTSFQNRKGIECPFCPQRP